MIIACSFSMDMLLYVLLGGDIMSRRLTKEEVKIRLLNKHKRVLTESQYNTCMRALGYTYDEELGRFFKDDMCFLGNVGDDVSSVSDLMTTNFNGHVSYRSAVLVYFMDKGAELTIGEGAIDEYGKKHKKALYCTNYREIFSDKKKVRSK